jgi:hypothetical protein
MSYKWFVFILVASTAASIALALWKAFGRKSCVHAQYIGTGNGMNGGVDPTFIGRLSWFAVPWPLFLGLSYLAWPYIKLILLWH